MSAVGGRAATGPEALEASLLRELDARLAGADEALATTFPGERPGRQPVHTVYVPADRHRVGLERQWGLQALAALDEHGGDAALASAAGLATDVAADVCARVRSKLASEPVEDLRVDFEDGYGTRPDAEEDAAVDAAVAVLLGPHRDDRAAPFCGIRFKALEAPTRGRGVRTLTRFVAGLAAAGPLPDGFVVTLPKVTSVEQVAAMVLACQRLERALGLADRSLRFEVQVETPQAVVGPDGTALVARMVHAAEGRCTGLHYGTYDYSASLGIAAAYQSMEHPAADHAKAVLQVAAAGTGVRLSDGSTNRLPVGAHRAGARGLGAARPARAALAGAGLLPGLGPPSGAAADPVRRDVRLLQGGPGPGGRAVEHLRWAGGRSGPRRAGNGPGARRLRGAGAALRRRRGGGDGGPDRPGPRHPGAAVRPGAGPGSGPDR